MFCVLGFVETVLNFLANDKVALECISIADIEMKFAHFFDLLMFDLCVAVVIIWYSPAWADGDLLSALSKSSLKTAHQFAVQSFLISQSPTWLFLCNVSLKKGWINNES